MIYYCLEKGEEMRLGRQRFSTLWVSIGLLFVSILLLTFQLIGFSRSRATYPSGLTIGGIPVGGLDRQGAADRLLEIYSLPVELRYGENLIHMEPAVVGFELNLESMLATADLARIGGPFWQEFWAFLWGNQDTPQPVPLDFTYSESQLRNYLNSEISSRYDQPAVPARAQVGTTNIIPGSPGITINIDNAIVQIENALRSPILRSVNLPLHGTAPPRLSFQNLEIALKQAIQVANFDGIAGVYLLDLQTAQEVHFVIQNGQDVVIQPTDVTFTASSIIKIPIMVSAFRRIGEPPPEEAQNLLTGMIEASGNDPADWLMEQFIDRFRGPLQVTEDMQTLGLMNTFLAGYFRFGSPLMAIVRTPSNQRNDISTDPDPYSQTTLTDIGMLLGDIYQCAENGGGSLSAVFPDQISQQECQQMISMLSRNLVPVLITAGVPEGTQVAHKHGWVSDLTGAINTIGDAGIIYTPSGNYVLVIYFNHPVQLVWEPISTLISDLSKIVYNTFNTTP